MAGILSTSKEEELLRIIPELQCHKCKNVPGLTENLRNRYFCLKASHTLCEDHNIKCPCGSKVSRKPSPLVAKFIQNLPWMCQNYKSGCREIKEKVEDLQHHQRKCIYRLVFCPNILCNQEGKIIFKDVIDHLKNETCLEEPILELNRGLGP